MPNKWIERYNVHRLKVDHYFGVMTNWDSINPDAPSGYYMSIYFQPIKYVAPIENNKEAKKKVLLNAKAVIEKMLIDVNKTIEEEGKEE